VFRHDRLAARGRRADQHPALPTIELLDGFALERIEVEGQRFLELFDQRLDCFHSGTRSVETSVIRAPSACASIYVSAAARTRSAWRASPLTVAIAISASCQRSSSPTSAAATFSSCRRRRSKPLTICRFDLSDPLSGMWITMRMRPTVRLDDILQLD